MFEGIGLAPVCVTLDFDTYDGPWTHVERFRRSSGWITAVRATIQSEHDILSTRLIAACDDRGNPIESWRAANLTHCEWSELAECDEHPPEVLDDLLCEEEGAFYARWQREMNTDLAALWERAQRRIETLEAKATLRSQMLQSQIADLRRRRRMTGVTTDTQIAINAIIADIEAEYDTAIAQLTGRRAQLRREVDFSEEALWQRSDILIEFDPVYTVRWTSGQMRPECEHARVWRCGAFYSSSRTTGSRSDQDEPTAVLARMQAALVANAAKVHAAEKLKKPVPATGNLPKASPALRKLAERQPSSHPRGQISPANHTQLPDPAHEAKIRTSVLKRRDKLEARAIRLRDALALPGSHPKWRLTTEGNLDRLERNIADIDARLGGHADYEKEEAAKEFEVIQDGRGQAAQSPDDAVNPARAFLIALLEELTEQGAKFLPGSPKTQRNLDERAEVSRRIALLDRHQTCALGGSDDDQRNWTQIEVDALRRLWSLGTTAGEIALTIGGISRTAVISKAKRLGLPFREQAASLPRQADEDQLTGPV